MINTLRISDMERLPKQIVEGKLPQTHAQLLQDPMQNGLRSHSFNAFKKYKVFRSYINDQFSIAWYYDENNAIVLWHVGDHAYIDSISTFTKGKIIDRIDSVDRSHQSNAEGFREENNPSYQKGIFSDISGHAPATHSPGGAGQSAKPPQASSAA